MNICSHRTLSAGLTRVEVLLAVLVLVLLAATVCPKICAPVPYAGVTAALMQLASFKTALDAFHADLGYFPRGTNGLSELVRQPPGTTNWRGPYLDSIPNDPWGRSYVYDSPSKRTDFRLGYDLISLGPPGQDAPLTCGPPPDEKATIQIALFEAALEAFRRDTGHYPAGTNGLMALLQEPPETTNWHGPYLQGLPDVEYEQLAKSTNWLSFFPYLHDLPKDPWGNEYIYSCPGMRGSSYAYELISAGPPGKNHIIANWQFAMKLP
jgi:general secretion pathway protein G